MGEQMTVVVDTEPMAIFDLETFRTALDHLLGKAGEVGIVADTIRAELKHHSEYAGMYSPDPRERLQQEELLTVHDELLTVVPVQRRKVDQRRLDVTYNQAGKLVPDAGTALAPFQRVYAVGANPEKALRALGRKIGWGRLTDFVTHDTDGINAWFFHFRAGGTSMKASGRFVPGGVIVDWWK